MFTAVGNLRRAHAPFQIPTLKVAAVFLTAVHTIPAGNVGGVGLSLAAFGGTTLTVAALSLTPLMIALRLRIHRPETVDGLGFPFGVLPTAFFLAALLRGAPAFLTAFGPVPAQYIGRGHILAAAVTLSAAIIATTLGRAARIVI